MNSISANLNIMIKASEKASKVLIRDFGEVEKLQVSIKGPSDFVSNADKKSEKIIIEELSKSRKKYSILSEEVGEINNSDTIQMILESLHHHLINQLKDPQMLLMYRVHHPPLILLCSQKFDVE